MVTEHLTDKDWREFMERFPDAQEFLLNRSLEREYQRIVSESKEGKTSIYARARYRELRSILGRKGIIFGASDEIQD